jgi:hypothetical protein
MRSAYKFLAYAIDVLILLILLIISFFAKIPVGAKYAGMLFGGIILQVALGMVAHAVPALGFIHGFWALLLFWLAYRTAKQADVVVDETTAPEAAAVR